MPTKTIPALKKKLWKVFSEYIRKQGMDKDGFNACYCCGKRYPWRKLQAGHFVSRTHSTILFDEMNVKPCCYACNIWRRGNIAEFANHLIQDYGVVKFQGLINLSRQPKSFSRDELEDLIEYYEREIKNR